MTSTASDTPTPRARKPRAQNAEAIADAAIASAAMLDPTEDEIRMRAYHRYLERGGGHGMDFDDWLAAERELRRSKSKV
jgi:hypothetical protein